MMPSLTSGWPALAGAGQLVEAEAFADKGGWSVDQQFVEQMGSPYLLATGVGRPVPVVSQVSVAPHSRGKPRV